MVKESFTAEVIPSRRNGVPQPTVGPGEEGHPGRGNSRS